MAYLHVVWQEKEGELGATTTRYGVAVGFVRENNITYAVVVAEKGKILNLPTSVLQATKVWKD